MEHRRFWKAPIRVGLAVFGMMVVVGIGMVMAQTPDCTVKRCTYLPLISQLGATPPTAVATATNTATVTATPTATHTATATRTPTRSPTPTQVTLPAIGNGDFELGDNGDWAAFGQQAVIVSGILPVIPRSGQWVARLGAPNTVSSLSQSFTLPAGLPAVLQFYNQVRSTQPCGVLPDFARIEVNGTVVHEGPICATFNVTEWSVFTIDLSDYAGQTVTVQFSSLNYSNPAASTLYIDDVSLQPKP